MALLAPSVVGLHSRMTHGKRQHLPVGLTFDSFQTRIEFIVRRPLNPGLPGVAPSKPTRLRTPASQFQPHGCHCWLVELCHSTEQLGPMTSRHSSPVRSTPAVLNVPQSRQKALLVQRKPATGCQRDETDRSLLKRRARPASSGTPRVSSKPCVLPRRVTPVHRSRLPSPR